MGEYIPQSRDRSPLGGKMSPPTSTKQHHASNSLLRWRTVRQNREGRRVVLDGLSLEIADVVAVAKYGTQAELSDEPQIKQQIDASIETLHTHLRDGHLVYGVSTGFGGSADTRTNDLGSLQRALVQHQNSGILTALDMGRPLQPGLQSSDRMSDDFDAAFHTQSMPTSWVRASLLTRCNSVIRGHSAVRLDVAEAIMALLRHEITPIIPMRGSISASGDLQPLSYVAAAIEGNPDVFVRCGKGAGKILTARAALEEYGLQPVVLRAKEGLGLLNGTAFSAATAALAIHECQEMTLLSQILTTMGVEAMAGCAESFYPQIASMRPHPGQIECAANILSFMSGSKLTRGVGMPKNNNMAELCQDRYAWRTASQWIGPQIEDLSHAERQLTTELNSTTDNPLIDVENDHILHGGNFQAAVVTSTMDRSRLALEKLGRILFAQAAELVNPQMNRGLPANLASDDPSLSFTCKGADINVAAYASELGFLANPVGNHVMSAELNNQAVNSLALISSRYTFQALDCLRMLSSAYLFMVCQALDLRILGLLFKARIEEKLHDMTDMSFSSHSAELNRSLEQVIISAFNSAWPEGTNLSLPDRCSATAERLMGPIVQHLIEQDSRSIDLAVIASFIKKFQDLLNTTYIDTRSEMYADHVTITSAYLGKATKEMYIFIRARLGISFHRGLIEHPTQPPPGGMSSEEASKRRLIGTQISVIYESLRNGSGSEIMATIVKDSLESSV